LKCADYIANLIDYDYMACNIFKLPWMSPCPGLKTVKHLNTNNELWEQGTIWHYLSYIWKPLSHDVVFINSKL
jgi:hypothetical protein